MNVFGQLIKSSFEKVSSDLTETFEGLFFYNTVDKQIKFRTNAALKVIADTSTAQTLTNKTLTSPAITSPTGIVKGDVGLGLADNTSDATKNSDVSTLTNKTITSPSITTPVRLDMKQNTLANLQVYAATATDGQLVYATDTKATYVIKSNALSAVGGGGTSNYVLSADADSGIGLWATYKNATGTAIPDGTITGTANSTFAVSASTALRGTANFLFTKNAGASRIGEGYYYPLTIDNSDKGKVLNCSMEYQIASGTFVDNAMEFFIWDVTNSRLIQPAPSKLKNSGIIEKLAFEFQTSIDSTSYRLFAHVGVATDSANTIRFDNVNISAQAKLYGSAITDWVAYTPTTTSFGNGAATAVYKREGDSMLIRALLTVGSTIPTGAYTFSLPSGFSMDSAKLAGSALGLGTSQYQNNGSGANYVGTVAQATSTSFVFYGENAQYQWNAAIPQAVPASQAVITATVRIPIVGWSSSQVMSSDAATTVVAARIVCNTAAIVFNSSSPIGIYPTVDFDTHGAYSATTGVYTVPVTGYYQIDAGVFMAATALSPANSIGVILYKDGVSTAYIAQSRTSNASSFTMNAQVSGSAKVFLNAGNSLTFRNYSDTASTSFSSAGLGATFISLSRLSGPSQIAASESVSALYTGAPPTASPTFAVNQFSVLTYGAKVKDSHNAYSGGSFIVPVSGVYDISAQVQYIATYSVNQDAILSVYLNGVEKYRGDVVAAAGQSNLIVAINVKSIPLLAGQIITIQGYTTGTSPTIATSSSNNFFSISRSGNF